MRLTSSWITVSVSADAVLGKLDAGADVLDPALDIARIGLAAEMLGGTNASRRQSIT